MAAEMHVLHMPYTIGEIPSGWSWERLDSVCDGVFDCPHSTPILSADGPYLARSQDMRFGVFRTDEAARVLEATYEERIARAEPRHGDLLYSREGTYFGIAAEVPAGIRVCLGQRMVLIRPKTSAVQFRFLRYWLNSPAMALYTAAHRDGSVAERLNLPTIRALPIVVPPLSEQRAIAHILGALDDKIELNRRMNQTLEAMALALFTSWFVDFDPVCAKAEGRGPGLPQPIADLFPESFEDSELGKIPKGWQVTSVDEVCRRIAMGPFGSDIKTDNFIASGVPVVRGGNLTNGFVDARFVFVSESKADELRNANAFPGDIVITHRGTLGQVGLIPERSRYARYVVSQSQMLLSVNRDVTTPRYVFDFLRSAVGQHALLANTSQTGVPAIARPTSSVRAIRLVLPPVRALRCFGEFVDSMYLRRDRGIEEVRALTDLRDTLLPKLISGELRVKNAETAVAAAV